MTTETMTQRRAAAVAPAGAGAGAAASVASEHQAQRVRLANGKVVNRVPAAKPAFTVADIRRAIPAHCFSRPLTKSFGYLFADLAIVAVLYYASSFIALVTDEMVGGSALWGAVVRHALWVVYWIVQGTVMTGLWVIGHECGHRGFADSELLNDAVGLVVHSLLLVPYFSWQISHKRHHSNTGSVEHDEVFVPSLATPEQLRAYHAHRDEDGFIEQTKGTLNRMFYIVVMLTLGWPAYLAMNVTGNQSYDPRAWVNHFFPSSPIYTTGSKSDSFNQMLIVLSDVTLVAVCALLYKCAMLTSVAHVLYTYFIPYLVVNFWLVLITYLQHTDLDLPHYTDGTWDWLRGALATIDRDYGVVNIMLHHITDTHVVHHLFSQMPHYHAEEATEAIKPLLGDYYRYDSTPIATALWNSFRDCTVLFPDAKLKGVHWFEPVRAA